MLIVDSQVHVADLGFGQWIDPEAEITDRAPFLKSPERKHSHPELTDLRAEMNRAGIDAAVLVPLFRRGTAALDNQTPIDAAARHPNQFAVMARLDEEREDVRALEQLVARPEVLGLRMSIHHKHGNVELLRSGSLEWIFEAAERLDAPLMIFAPGLSRELSAVAAGHPNLRIICDHLCVETYPARADLRDAVRPVLELARYDNIAVKATSLPSVVTEGYPYPLLRECMREVLGAFGPARVFWGSDISRLPCRVEQWLRFFTEQLEFLAPSDLAQVLGGGLIRWLSWTQLQTRFAP